MTEKDLKSLRAYNGWSPELFAARFGNCEILKYFLEEVIQEP